jgi:hypothetical protein
MKAKKVIAAGVGAVVVFGLGASALSYRASAQAARGEIDSVIADRSALVAERDDALQQRDEAITELGTLPEREEALAEERENLKQGRRELRQEIRGNKERMGKWWDDLNARKKGLDKREQGLDHREQAVGIVEKEIRQNSFPGNGVYEVGRDIAAGSYGTSGNDCYWAITSDPNGANILNNYIGSGPTLATLSAGTYFTTNRCGTWAPR